MDEQVYELTRGDLDECSAWCFPMDETVRGALTVRPSVFAPEHQDAQVIVKASFVWAINTQYSGCMLAGKLCAAAALPVSVIGRWFRRKLLEWDCPLFLRNAQ